MDSDMSGSKQTTSRLPETTSAPSPMTAGCVREFAGQFATGVSVITACDADGHYCGLTVNALTSLSLDPPLYLVCLDNSSNTLSAVLAEGAFGINFLRDDQRDIADRFAGKGPDKFSGVACRSGHLGVPVLVDALANAVCRLDHTVPGGDHRIVLGRPEDYEIHDGRPLLFFRGHYLGDPA